jgi:hypothetical protein
LYVILSEKTGDVAAEKVGAVEAVTADAEASETTGVGAP